MATNIQDRMNYLRELRKKRLEQQRRAQPTQQAQQKQTAPAPAAPKAPTPTQQPASSMQTRPVAQSPVKGPSLADNLWFNNVNILKTQDPNYVADERKEAKKKKGAQKERPMQRKIDVEYLRDPKTGTLKAEDSITLTDIYAALRQTPAEEREIVYELFEQDYLKKRSSPFYDPYYSERSNNKAAMKLWGTEDLTSVVTDPANLKYLDYIVPNKNGQTPKAPTKKSSLNEQKGYSLYYLLQDHNDELAAKAEMPMLYTELGELAKAYPEKSEREILDAFDWDTVDENGNKAFKTIAAYRKYAADYMEKYTVGGGLYVGDESLKAVIRAARRGDDVSEVKDYIKQGVDNDLWQSMTDENEARRPVADKGAQPQDSGGGIIGWIGRTYNEAAKKYDEAATNVNRIGQSVGNIAGAALHNNLPAITGALRGFSIFPEPTQEEILSREQKRLETALNQSITTTGKIDLRDPSIPEDQWGFLVDAGLASAEQRDALIAQRTADQSAPEYTGMVPGVFDPQSTGMDRSGMNVKELTDYTRTLEKQLASLDGPQLDTGAIDQEISKLENDLANGADPDTVVPQIQALYEQRNAAGSADNQAARESAKLQLQAEIDNIKEGIATLQSNSIRAAKKAQMDSAPKEPAETQEQRIVRLFDADIDAMSGEIAHLQSDGMDAVNRYKFLTARIGEIDRFLENQSADAVREDKAASALRNERNNLLAERNALDLKYPDFDLSEVDIDGIVRRKKQEVLEAAFYQYSALPVMDPSFGFFATKGGAMRNPAPTISPFNVTMVPDGINNPATYARDHADEIAAVLERGAEASTGTPLYKLFEMSFMDDSEVAKYSYLLANPKYGPEKAELYFESIHDQLRYRYGEQIAAPMMGNPWTSIPFALAVGAEQHLQGTKQVFSPDEILPTTSMQYAGGLVQAGLEDVGAQLPDWLGGGSVATAAYQLSSAFGGMIPTAIMNTFIPGSGPYELWVSAGGNSYREALMDDRSKEEAARYGIIRGALEAGLESAFGMIATGGGKVTSALFKKASTAMRGPVADFSLRLAMSMASNGNEEYWQEVLDPVVQSFAYGEEYQDLDFTNPEAVRSGLIGVLMGAIGDSPAIATQIFGTKADGVDFNNPEDVRALIEGGLYAPEESKAYKDADAAATRIEAGKDLGDYRVGKLAESVGPELVVEAIMNQEASIDNVVSDGASAPSVSAQPITGPLQTAAQSAPNVALTAEDIKEADTLARRTAYAISRDAKSYSPPMARMAERVETLEAHAFETLKKQLSSRQISKDLMRENGAILTKIASGEMDMDAGLKQVQKNVQESALASAEYEQAKAQYAQLSEELADANRDLSQAQGERYQAEYQRALAENIEVAKQRVSEALEAGKAAQALEADRQASVQRVADIDAQISELDMTDSQLEVSENAAKRAAQQALDAETEVLDSIGTNPDAAEQAEQASMKARAAYDRLQAVQNQRQKIQQQREQMAQERAELSNRIGEAAAPLKGEQLRASELDMEIKSVDAERAELARAETEAVQAVRQSAAELDALESSMQQADPTDADAFGALEEEHARIEQKRQNAQDNVRSVQDQIAQNQARRAELEQAKKQLERKQGADGQTTGNDFNAEARRYTNAQGQTQLETQQGMEGQTTGNSFAQEATQSKNAQGEASLNERQGAPGQNTGNSFDAQATQSKNAKGAEAFNEKQGSAGQVTGNNFEGQKPGPVQLDKTDTPLDRVKKLVSSDFESTKVDPNDILVDPDTYQFKGGADASGVTTPITGKYSPSFAGAIVVHRRLNGDMYVADGHHRREFAIRSGVTGIEAIVLNESDGITVADARAFAAARNLAQGRGTALDAAKVFRDAKVQLDDLSDLGLTAKEAVVQSGMELAALSDEYWDRVVSGALDPATGAIMGRYFPGNHKMQAEFMKLLGGRKYNQSVQVELAELLSRATQGIDAAGGQVSFDFFDRLRSNALEMAQILSALRKRFALTKNLFGTLAREKKQGMVESVGTNKLDVESNRAESKSNEAAENLLDSFLTRPKVLKVIDGLATAVATKKKTLAQAIDDGYNSLIKMGREMQNESVGTDTTPAQSGRSREKSDGKTEEGSGRAGKGAAQGEVDPQTSLMQAGTAASVYPAAPTNQDNVQRVSKTAKDLYRAMGVRHTSKHKPAILRKMAQGLYEHHSGTVVTRTHQDVNVYAHELGHAIFERAKVFDRQGNPSPAFKADIDAMVNALPQSFANLYAPNELGREASAYFMNLYLLNRDAAINFAGQDFVNRFEAQVLSKNQLKAMRKARNQFNLALTAELVDNYRARIDYSGKQEVARGAEGAWGRFIQGFADRYYGIELFDIAANKQGYDNADPARRAYIAFSNIPYSITQAANIIEQNLSTPNGTVIGESFKDIMRGIARENMEDWNTYITALHDIDRQAVGKPVFGDYTAQTSNAVAQALEQAHPEFRQAHQNLMNWWNAFVDEWVVNTNAIEDAKAKIDHFRELYPNYVPTFRSRNDQTDVMTEEFGDMGGMLGQASVHFARAKGGDQAVISPIASFVARVGEIVTATNKVLAMRRIHDAYQATPGLGDWLREVPADKVDGGGKDEMLRIIDESGEVHHYQVMDKLLYDALLNGTTKTDGKMWDAIGALTGVFKQLTTMSNPFFALSNAMRDYTEAYTKGSNANPVTFAAQWVKAIVQLTAAQAGKSSAMVDAYYAAGGGDSSIAPRGMRGVQSMERTLYSKYFSDSLRRMVAGSNFKERARGGADALHATGARLKEGINAFNNVIEGSQRFAEFSRTYRKTGDADAAMYASTNVTTDFRRAGNWDGMNKAGKVFAFMNAGIQGTYSWYRMAKEARFDPKAFYSKAGRAAIMFAMVPIAQLLLVASMDDDDKEAYAATAPNVKADHIMIPRWWIEGRGITTERFIKIPKPKSPIPAVGDAIGRALIEAMEKEGSWDAFAAYGASDWALESVENVVDAINPYGSPIFAPVTQIMMNQTWYHKDIESKWMRDENIAPANRIKDTTSSAAIWIAHLPGLYNNVSPIQVDYFLNQMFGIAGDYITGDVGNAIIDKVAGQQNNYKLGSSSASFIRSRIYTDPTIATDFTSSMYDLDSLLQGIVADAGQTGRGQDPYARLNPNLTESERKAAVLEAKKMTKKGGVLFKAKKLTSQHYNEIDAIQADPKLPEEDKVIKIREVKWKMILENIAAVNAAETFIKKYVKGTPEQFKKFYG